MNPGTEVGAKRWPYSACHSDCWEAPHKGIVLERDDPRAWARTMAFPSAEPDPEAVKRHVAWCHKEFGESNSVPVLWLFADGPRVFWEPIDSIRPYGEDLAEWMESRNAARSEGR